MMALRTELEKALEQALRDQIADNVRILLRATDDEETGFKRFETGARKIIERHRRLVTLLNRADLGE
jgi:hypothetical protein